jgi:hypothetical protein
MSCLLCSLFIHALMHTYTKPKPIHTGTIHMYVCVHPCMHVLYTQTHTHIHMLVVHYARDVFVLFRHDIHTKSRSHVHTQTHIHVYI